LEAGAARAQAELTGAPPADAKALVDAPKGPGDAPVIAKPTNSTSATVSAGGQLATGNSRQLAATANGLFETRFGEIIRETPASPIQILVAPAFAFYCQFWGFDAGSASAELPSLHKFFAWTNANGSSERNQGYLGPMSALAVAAGLACVFSAFLMASSISLLPSRPMILSTILPSRPTKKLSGRYDTPP